MKTKVLIIQNNLNCGGAEKSLVTLLNTINYKKYQVDLFLFKHEGIFLKSVPSEVNLLPELEYYKYFDMNFKMSIKNLLNEKKFNIAYYRVLLSIILKINDNSAIVEQKMWKYISKTIPEFTNQYDVAIGYQEKNPVYFCIDKVNAKKKIGWIHTDINKLQINKKKELECFQKLDYIVTVSEECAKSIKEISPKLFDKIKVIYNILSPKLISNLSKVEVIDGPQNNENRVNIITVARLGNEKGIDLAINSCKILVDRGYHIYWYVIGEGKERDNLNSLINKLDLKENFKLLGIRENPYPYIEKADIYVQPSKYEGKSIALDEAKILSKPIIVTNYTTSKDQINNDCDGLIVDMNELAIAEGIEKLINDNSLRNFLSNNLLKQNLGTENEINKLYNLLGHKSINLGGKYD
ncbi:glycosyltransferase [Metabacillus idriensis]|uniref:glycosyltransferase n=1 Tax=Metabacillus idriensis TaxID=324768 RepID=UPI00174CDC56|nr:glycosyltransferase [Metabacillus idriensis]